jgi:hypothetical protein
MAILGIILGIITFFVVGAIGWPLLGSAQASILPAALAGIWVTWPFCRGAFEQRANFFHPIPREYNRPTPEVFKRLRDMLAESTVQYGDSWHVKTADTQTGRIVADLRYMEEESKIDLDGRNNPHVRKERVRRFLRLEAQMKKTDRDTTILQLDWSAEVEGANFTACDGIISSFSQSLDASLGGGTEVAVQATNPDPIAPPWWLIGFTGFVLCWMFLDLCKSCGGDDITKSINETRAKGIERGRDKLNYELEEWQKYKQREGIE